MEVQSVVPNPLRTHEEWERFSHADVPELTDKALLVELWRTQSALAEVGDTDPDGWLWERWEALSRELQGRRRDGN